MNDQEIQSILTIALMAAFADDGKSEPERAEVKRIAESLSAGGPVQLSAIYQQVLLKRASLEGAVQGLATPELRQLAYEMAVCVCDADGVQNEAEKAFLAHLCERLQLPKSEAQAFSDQAEAVAEGKLEQPSALEPPPLASTMAPAEMDKMILNYAILNGALELLPDSLSTMAIIPLQMKMVYRVGKSHGFELDRGHIKDFLATAGVGLTSQYLEEAATKLVGGLLRKVGGRMLGGLGRQATSSAMSFATTYALGHVAKRYYAGGRTLGAAALKAAFDDMLGEAKTLQQRYLPEMQAKARSIDVQQVMASLRS